MKPLNHPSFWWLSVIWSGLVILSSVWYQHNLDQQVILIATEHARDNWQKDAAFRRWATDHGGLYVKVNERTPPSPGLAHLPHRDVTTTDGTQLTLMNPAYMMRQMTQEFEQMYGVKGKITGKVLLNPPINQADTWELKVLNQFEAGQLEAATEIQNIDQEPYLRYMKPMLMTSEGCVTCHGHLGYKLGDVRGGVSVSIPLSGYRAAMEKTKHSALLSHALGWLVGIIGIWIYQMRKSQQEHYQHEMERKIQRSLRMGSIGQMAGGIAHDFNNILNIIIGNADLLKMKLDDDNQKKHIDKMMLASERGAKLTQRLLDFARGETGDLNTFNPAEVITNLLDMLQATVPDHIELCQTISNRETYLQANKDRFEDSITNIILNAIDALENVGQGKIKITLNYLLPEDINIAKDSGTDATEYCHIKIEDNGEGMSPDTLEKIFEPFYTTKPQGKGTGLGLSQVYSFVKAHSGFIEVHSTPTKATVFDIYLPITLSSGKSEESQLSESECRGFETLLIVDDEIEVAKVVKHYLEALGYTTIIEQSSTAALSILENQQVNALITDVMMPNINGYELVQRARKKQSNLPVIYMSGYSVENLEHRYPEELKNSQKLNKPLRQAMLAKTLRDLLDGVNDG